MDLETLRKKRADALAATQSLLATCDAEQRELTSEESTQFDRAMADAASARKQLERYEQVAALEAEQGRSMGRKTVADASRGIGPSIDDALRGFLSGAANEEQRAAMDAFGMHGNSYTFSLSRDVLRSLNDYDAWETRAQSISTATKGPELIPSSFSGQVEKALLANSAVRNVASTFRTAGGESFKWPTVDDTDKAASLTAESTSVTATDAEFSSVTFGAYKLSSLILVPNELIADSGVPIGSIVADLLGERIARKEEPYFTTGTGTSQHEGIVTGSALGLTLTSKTAVAYDDILDAYFSVDASYRANASWMFSDTTLSKIARVTDGDGRHIWLQSLAGNMPSTLLGKPVVINNNMADLDGTASAKIALFGDMSRFRIRDVRALEVKVLRERWGDADQTGFIVFARSDSRMINAGTNPVKHVITAAV